MSAWKRITIRNNAHGQRTTPFASIIKGQLTFSTAACKLLSKPLEEYKSVAIYEELKGKHKKIGFHFLTTPSTGDNTLPVKKRIYQGQIRNFRFANISVLSELFGSENIRSASGCIRYAVTLDPDNSDMLVVVPTKYISS